MSALCQKRTLPVSFDRLMDPKSFRDMQVQRVPSRPARSPMCPPMSRTIKRSKWRWTCCAERRATPPCRPTPRRQFITDLDDPEYLGLRWYGDEGRPPGRMSALGKKQTSQHVRAMSAFPPKADIHRARCEEIAEDLPIVLLVLDNKYAFAHASPACRSTRSGSKPPAAP